MGQFLGHGIDSSAEDLMGVGRCSKRTDRFVLGGGGGLSYMHCSLVEATPLNYYDDVL